MPKVKHEILSWARETAGLSIEDAARKLQLQDSKTTSASEKLIAYESGAKEPSRPMLLKMSKVYYRPLLTFYLGKPPRIGDRGEDFRTLPENFQDKGSTYVDVLIRSIKARQSLVREALIEENEATQLVFVGSASIEQGVHRVTKILKQILDIELAKFRNQRDYKSAFKLLREKAEEIGIFVLLKGNLGSHHTDIDVETFRGFALSDDIAPFIVINHLDAKSAWSFTLIHEIVHIILGQTGISGINDEQRIEKFCNDVASEFLLPKQEFDNFHIHAIPSDKLAEYIREYAFSKKVSNSHIAYRLYRKGDINRKQWINLRDYYYEQWQKQKEKDRAKMRDDNGRVPRDTLSKYRLGALVELAKRLNYSGALSTAKTGILLDVKPISVHRLFKKTKVA